jgi:hypothetical protein
MKKPKNKKKQHVYEVSYPAQCAEFRRILDNLYRLFLDKGKEYSPNNIKVLGQFGVSLRILEKIIRALNIQGYDPFEGKFKEKINTTKFGNTMNEMEDIANLAVIAAILGSGKWGK